MTDIYVKEPEYGHPDDYRYVANCAPGNVKSLVVIEAEHR